jgi:GT2 family glycosyltransferase
VIPVLAVPVLDRYDLLVKMEDSVDIEVARYYVIDNGGRYEGPTASMREHAEAIHVCNPGFNLGFGGAINLAIKANIGAMWWMFSNDDMIFAEGHLAALEKRMWEEEHGPAVAFMSGHSAFAVNDKAIEKVGWFDESYHPAYCEDCDFDWRSKLLGVARIDIPGGSLHKGSQTIYGNQMLRSSNDRTYKSNVAYHTAKWGGAPWAEVYTTPWNEGGDPSDVSMPRLSRLRKQAW